MKKKKEVIEKISILGTEYEMQKATQDFLSKTYGSSGFIFGLCDYDKKKIYLDNELTTSEYIKTLRHEIVHAFFFESGLDMQSDFARNEELVDYLALQMPKMFKVCNDLKII